MESLSETKWDVVIAGTGLQNSLLALALSRSDKKVLHVDQNEYYGDAEAAFSLQEADEWVKKFDGDRSLSRFRNATLWKLDNDDEATKLSFSRAYTLTLSPQIVYSKSKLLAQLVSSKVYRQLEFQAVGNWWMYDTEGASTLRRLPNGREDISQDKSIDNKSKRRLMKFLNFVIDYKNNSELWEPHAEEGLGNFLSSAFQLPPSLQAVITALTLTLDDPDTTPVAWALARIERHLTSIGVFGPGFGAVIPKWGGGAEISQVACRACAVGGGIYILGTGVQESAAVSEDDEERIAVSLTNGETVKTRRLVGVSSNQDNASRTSVSRIIAIVSSPLTSLFKSTVEGSPLSAVCVIVYPAGSLTTEELAQPHPIYIMVHSSETGECPIGQSVLYATMQQSSSSKVFLENCLSSFLSLAEDGEGKLLFKLYYEQNAFTSGNSRDDPSLDLAFHDGILDNVEEQWRSIVDPSAEDKTRFMQFEERNAFNEEDDENEGY